MNGLQEEGVVTQFSIAPDVKFYDAGDVIFEQGEPGDVMYVVAAGEIDIEIDGNYIETVKDGEVLGEIALLSEIPRISTARARTATTIVPISSQRFAFMIDNTPAFAMNVMRMLNTRLKHNQYRRIS